MNGQDPRDAFPDSLRGLAVPVPPPGLRARAIAAARAGLEQPGPSRWVLLWRNPSLRLAWAAAMAALLVAHGTLTLRQGTRRPEAAPQGVAPLPRVEPLAARFLVPDLFPEESQHAEPN